MALEMFGDSFTIKARCLKRTEHPTKVVFPYLKRFPILTISFTNNSYSSVVVLVRITQPTAHL